MTNLTWQQIAARWDAQADSYNRWDDLGFDEQIEFAFQQGVIEEREACADIVDNWDNPDCGGWNASGISQAIRNRESNL